MNSPPGLPPSSVDPTILLAIFATLCGAAFVVAVVLAIRRRDVLPVAVCIGALICSLNEPIYDLLGKIVYAADNPIAYTNFGRAIPWFLVLGYLPWVGLLPYLISRLMAAGVQRRSLYAIALGSFASVVVIESIGTSLGSWAYYGEPPLKFLGVAPQMAAVPVVGGLLLFALDSRVRSTAGRAVAGLVTPTLALPMVYASTSWPLYTALYADIPKLLEWVAGAVTLGFAAAAVAFAVMVAERLREAGETAPEHRLTADTADLEPQRSYSR